MTQYSSTGGTATSRPGETAAEFKQTASEATQRIKDTAGQTLHDVRGTLGNKANTLLNDQRMTACSKVEGFADALRQSAATVGDRDPALGRFMSGAAGQVQGLASYVRGHDLRDMYEQTERFARQHPAIFLGGLFVAGTLAARFLKASHERGETAPFDPSRGSFGDGYTPEDDHERQRSIHSTPTSESRISPQWPE
jgi:hypothetical protein